jgi:hypothetical protein
MIRALIALSTALLLSGCAALNIKRPVAEEDLKATKRVAVVSLMGNTFHGVSIGTTAFNNESFAGSVPEWNMDGYASKAALEMLTSNPRFASSLLDRSNLSIEQARADGGKLLWQAAERQGFDRVVVVRPGVSDNNPFFRPSYGFFERSLFGNGRRCVYAAYTVDVYDVPSQKPIAWEWGGGVPCSLGKDNDLTYKKSFADYSQAERAEMRQRLERRFTESLRYSLEKLALIQATSASQ